MINEASVRAVHASRWGSDSVKPLYDSFCFAQVPHLVASLFGEEDRALKERLLGPLAGSYDTVILLLVDGFGWRFLERYQERYPFLSRFRQEGVVTMLTAQFPSTTAAHITTIHTGLPVGQSGVYEWFYYEPLLDCMIAPLSFSLAEDAERNTLQRVGVAPERLFPRTTVYQALRRQGIKSFVVQSRDFTPSPFTNVVCDGAHLLPSASLQDGLRTLTETALREKGRSYFYLYFGGIDSAGHHRGIGSRDFQVEVDTCFQLLESLVHAGFAGRLKKALLLLTADHGQIETDPARVIHLDKVVPEVLGWLETNRRGQPLLPAGFQRDLFLHVRPEHLSEAQARLQERLEGRAEVCLVSDLIGDGLFGPGPPSATFLSRVGNLVILPERGETVWWSRQVFRQFSFYGQHGGLSREEMETPLLALQYA